MWRMHRRQCGIICEHIYTVLPETHATSMYGYDGLSTENRSVLYCMDPSHPYIEFHETVVSHNTVHCVCSVGPKTLARQGAKGVTAKAVRTISINNQVSALYNKALGISQGLNYQHNVVVPCRHWSQYILPFSPYATLNTGKFTKKCAFIVIERFCQSRRHSIFFTGYSHSVASSPHTQ